MYQKASRTLLFAAKHSLNSPEKQAGTRSTLTQIDCPSTPKQFHYNTKNTVISNSETKKNKDSISLNLKKMRVVAVQKVVCHNIAIVDTIIPIYPYLDIYYLGQLLPQFPSI